MRVHVVHVKTCCGWRLTLRRRTPHSREEDDENRYPRYRECVTAVTSCMPRSRVRECGSSLFIAQYPCCNNPRCLSKWGRTNELLSFMCIPSASRCHRAVRSEYEQTNLSLVFWNRATRGPNCRGTYNTYLIKRDSSPTTYNYLLSRPGYVVQVNIPQIWGSFTPNYFCFCKKVFLK